MDKKIGFIGQGWIGKNYADDFEQRGYQVVRYAQEPPYNANKEKIKECDIVFIAVPTPTTPKGFDDSILREVVKLVGDNKIAVIKSTILPGTTESLQQENPKKYIFHSPEFLTEASAARDAANPKRNIIGIPVDSEEFRLKAEAVLVELPQAPFTKICRAREAELVKYGGNNWFYFKVIFINLLYDLAQKMGCDYEVIKECMAADSRIGPSHLIPVHKSGTPGSDVYKEFQKQTTGGRGAGGHCFIKDYAAFTRLYQEMVGDELGNKVLEAIGDKNINLLVSTGKDLDLLAGVYGEPRVQAEMKKNKKD